MESRKPAGGDGLIFDWTTHRTPRLSKLWMLVLATLVCLLPLAVVRIQVGRPPVQKAHGATMMILTAENDPLDWRETARNLGPFPTRYAPADWQPSLDVFEAALVAIRAMPQHGDVPAFEDLPDDGVLPMLPLVVKGSRHFPPVSAPDLRPVEVVAVRLMPTLYPLSADVGEWPAGSPAFEGDVSSEMAFQPWRFLLQVAQDGKVVQAIALIGHNAPGRGDLTRWLQAHRFPAAAADMMADRWYAVAVTFQNIPIYGPDDP